MCSIIRSRNDNYLLTTSSSKVPSSSSKIGSDLVGSLSDSDLVLLLLGSLMLLLLFSAEASELLQVTWDTGLGAGLGVSVRVGVGVRG